MNPQSPKNAEAAAVLSLAECGYLDDRKNVLFLGPIGTGKTHLAIALGIAACQRSRPPGPRGS